MSVSLVGALVFIGILLMARNFESPLIVALFASLTFGSTSLFTLSAIGGATPLLSAVFVLLLVAGVALRRNALHEFGAVLREQPAVWLLLLLVAYSVLGAFLLPRLLAGQTGIFMLNREAKTLALVPLMPSSGNITQTMYFILSAATFFAFCILLRERRALKGIRQGILVWATLHVLFGFVDLAGKMAGLGDVLAPIRTASYAMLTQVEVASFWRIAGSYPEASAFGALTAALLAYMVVYWRITYDRTAFVLGVALLLLLVLSTSSTAYVTGAVLAAIMMMAIAGSAMRSRLRRQEITLLVLGLVGLSAVLSIQLVHEKALDPLWQLFDRMVLEKASSASAHERAFFNEQSLNNFIDTYGLGVGLGSSRASSWIIAVISQLGLVGSMIIAYLSFELFRIRRVTSRAYLDLKEQATVCGMRACALAFIIGSSISAGSADPGMVYFIALATVLVVTPIRSGATRPHVSRAILA
jgi:hypothetical protein